MPADYISNMFYANSHTYSLRQGDFYLPRFNTVTYGKHSVRYLGSRLWRKLTNRERSTINLKQFSLKSETSLRSIFPVSSFIVIFTLKTTCSCHFQIEIHTKAYKKVRFISHFTERAPSTDIHQWVYYRLIVPAQDHIV